MRKVGNAVRRMGRPPSGPKGEKVSEYQQLTIRLPATTRALLDAARGATGIPLWRLIDRAVRRYVRDVPAPGPARRRPPSPPGH